MLYKLLLSGLIGVSLIGCSQQPVKPTSGTSITPKQAWDVSKHTIEVGEIGNSKLFKMQVSEITNKSINLMTDSSCGRMPVEPIYLPIPYYPKELLKKGITADIQMHIRVGTNGKVKTIQFSPNTDSRFLFTSINSLKSWHFKPAICQGKPVEFTFILPVSFDKKRP